MGKTKGTRCNTTPPRVNGSLSVLIAVCHKYGCVLGGKKRSSFCWEYLYPVREVQEVFNRPIHVAYPPCPLGFVHARRLFVALYEVLSDGLAVCIAVNMIPMLHGLFDSFLWPYALAVELAIYSEYAFSFSCGDPLLNVRCHRAKSEHLR